MGSILFARAGERASALVLNLVKCWLGLLMLGGTALLVSGRAWPLQAEASQITWLSISGVLGLTLGDTAFFAALIRLGPRRALLFWALVPPMTAVLAFLFLDEPLTSRMMGGIAVVILGVGWVIAERSGSGPGRGRAVLPGALLGLTAALCQSVGSIITKRVDDGLSALDVSVIRLFAGSVGLLVQVVLARRMEEAVGVLKDQPLLRLLIASTFIGTYLGIWLSIYGLQHTYAGVAATLQATSPIFVLPLAVIFMNERLSARAVLGAIVAVGGVAMLMGL
ncbi:MAG: DMT family transporter [Myxococcales bacterium]|nr:DMT family transporter [Myxococcales bacterium]